MREIHGCRRARKLSAILFLQSFSSCVEELRKDAVQKASDEIIGSARFGKILGIILSLDNKDAADAITTNSLLKLNQAPLFDQKTTFLQFVVCSIRRHPWFYSVKITLQG